MTTTPTPPKLYEPISTEELETLLKCVRVSEFLCRRFQESFSAVSLAEVNETDFAGILDCEPLYKELAAEFDLPPLVDERLDMLWAEIADLFFSRINATCFVMEVAHTLHHAIYDVDILNKLREA